jgi:hypothetical protein
MVKKKRKRKQFAGNRVWQSGRKPRCIRRYAREELHATDRVQSTGGGNAQARDVNPDPDSRLWGARVFHWSAGGLPPRS